jgi:hypothetical protein
MENNTILNSSISTTVDSVLNLTSMIIDILALLVCLTLLCTIIYRLIRIKYNRNQMKIDVPSILAINTLCIIIIKSTMQIIHVAVPTLLKDFQIVTEFEETFFYRVRAYMLWSMVGVLYWSYVLLAFFRFVRVIYPTQIRLHRSSLYLYILIPAQFICVFISMLPLIYIFDSLHLLANEAYCSISFEHYYPVLYTAIITFFIPFHMMCIFYMCIVRKMRQPLLAQPYRERNQRDYIVIRRMLLNMVILSIVAVPYSILYIVYAIQNQFKPLIYRVQWLSSSAGSCLFSVILPLITTQLRDYLRPNRLTPAVHQT